MFLYIIIKYQYHRKGNKSKSINLRNISKQRPPLTSLPEFQNYTHNIILSDDQKELLSNHSFSMGP